MRSVRLIPCLDVTGGRVVKGVQFVDLTDEGDPVELAARYDAEGADELTFLDITASSDGRETMVSVVARTAEQVFIPLTVGGGVRVAEDARRLLRAGADKVAVNTAAVERPELVRDIADEFGGQCAVVAIDARARDGGGGWELYTHGGRTPVGRDVVAWAVECAGNGAGEILLTSMDRDGTRDGFDLALTRAVVDAVDIPVVASGGVGRLQDLVDGAVDGGADAVLAASIFHRHANSPSARRRRTWPTTALPSGRSDLEYRRRAVPCLGAHVDDQERNEPGQGPKNGRGAGRNGRDARDTRDTRRETPEAPRRKSTAPKTEDKQPITVLFDRVMVQISASDGERRSRAGILIPATAQITRRLTWAEAVAVGPHVRSVKIGDNVLFNPEDRFEVEVHGEEYVILRERDIHAIASPRNDSGTGLYL